jgi:hypothetical protein
MLVAPLSALAVLACAATAAAQAPTQAPQRAAGGQPFPPGMEGWYQSLTGHAPTTVPSGWTVLSWSFGLDAGASATMDLGCPSGTAIGAIGPDGSANPAPVTVTITPNDFLPFYGSTGPTVTATASQGQPGTLQFMVVCMPGVHARTTIVRGRSPVTFPASDEGLGLRKGRPIPRSWRLYKSVVRKVGASGAVVTIAGGCPGDTQQNAYAITSRGPRGQALPRGGFTLGPSTKYGKGPVTVYTLCSSLNV